MVGVAVALIARRPVKWTDIRITQKICDEGQMQATRPGEVIRSDPI